jgi:hypothetical protein
MILFVKLLLAHLLADFLLQPNSWIIDKENNKLKSKYLYFHVLLHGVLAATLVGEIAFIPYAAGLALIHGMIDSVKLYFQKKKTKRIWFLGDQLMHLVSLIVIALVYAKPNFENTTLDPRFWIVITGIVFVTIPTSILIKNGISIWTPESKDKGDDSLQNAGNYIGMLERLLIYCFILTGHFEAIGFLLAAKSIFRFGDLKEAQDRKLTEYVLIGTLLSFGIAIATGLLVQYGLLQSL